MAYTSEDGTVTVTCDLKADKQCMESLAINVKRGQTDLAAYRELWTLAVAMGWTSTSEQHMCYPCANLE